MFYDDHNDRNENTCVKEYDKEDRTKECSTENTNVTDETAEGKKYTD